MARAFHSSEMAEEASSDPRQRAWRMLMLCLALSVALHLAMLVALPGFVASSEPLKARILDVVVQREPMPPVSVEAGTRIPPTPPSRNNSAITKTPHIVEPGRRPEAEPARPAVIAEPVRDSFPVQAPSAKQDDARPSTTPDLRDSNPPAAGTTTPNAAGRGCTPG